MPIRVQCNGCRSTLDVKDALAGKQGACPKCGATIQVPAPGEAAQKTLASATGREMLAELHRRNKSAVLVLFDTPADRSYELSRNPEAHVRCYRTADMNDADLLSVIDELGKMTKGGPNAQGGIELGAEGASKPFELKGDPVGSTLAEFKAKYARKLGAGMTAPFCSDSLPGQPNQALLSEPWHAAAGIVHGRIDLPSENASPTIAGVDAELLLYQFVDERLFRITALFDTDEFHHIREALSEKHGPMDEELKDPLGFIWRNGVSRIELIRGSIRPKKPSMLHFIHAELFNEFQSRTPKRASDL